MNPSQSLVAEMEAAAKVLGIEPSTLGERAGQGGRFFARLKEGKRAWPETVQKVREKIAEMTEAKAMAGNSDQNALPDDCSPVGHNDGSASAVVASGVSNTQGGAA